MNGRKNFIVKICRHKNFILFIIFLTLYLFCGMRLTYSHVFTDNIYFGADNYRVYQDLSVINCWHYRLRLHPLFLILCQGPALIITGITNYSPLTVIILEAFAGSMSVVFLNKILEVLKIERAVRGITTVLFGFSFSNLIFSSISESFMFACAVLTGFWYFILIMSGREGKINKEEAFVLSFFGLAAFGITITNYIWYIIGIGYLVRCRYKNGRRKSFFQLIRINVTNVILLAVLNLIQHIVWRRVPLFWQGLSEQWDSEVRYMLHEFTWDRLTVWVKQTMIYPLFSPDAACFENKNAGYWWIGFLSFSNVMKIIVVVFFAIIILCMMIGTTSKNLDRRYCFVIMSAYAGNLILHFIYGTYEAYIYSPHFLFYFIILLSVLINRCRHSKCYCVICIGLSVISIAELVNNLSAVLKTANISYSIEGNPVSLGYVILLTIATSFIFVLVYVWLVFMKVMRAEDDIANYSRAIQNAWNIILGGSIAVALVITYVGLNYRILFRI